MPRAPFPTLLCAILFASVPWLPARAELPSLTPQQTLEPLPSDEAGGTGQFGRAVAVRGNLALVGMPFGNQVAPFTTGRVAAYSRGADGAWNRSGTLMGRGNAFGLAIAFRDNTAVILSTDFLHIFKFRSTTGTWHLLRMHPTPGAVLTAVDYENGRIAVTTSDRALFVWDIDAAGNIVRQTRLTAMPGFTSDRFGFDVALAGNTIVAGAPARSTGQNSGRAHVFRLSNGQWFKSQTLAPIDGGPGDEFGSSVAIDNAIILIGSPGNQPEGDPSTPPFARGAVYAYTPSAAGQWLLQTKIRPSADEHPFYHSFGLHIAMSATKVVVVARHAGPQSPANFSPGLAFAYDRSGADFTAFAVARPESGLHVFQFGQGVSLSNWTVLVGSPLSQCATGCVGSAVTFDLRRTEPFP